MSFNRRVASYKPRTDTLCRLAYRHGVTVAISAPIHSSFFGGLSAAFSLGSPHKLEDGAVVRDVAAVHVKLAPEGVPSVSTQVAALRNLLLRPSGDVATRFEQVTNVSGLLIELRAKVDCRTGHASPSRGSRQCRYHSHRRSVEE